MRIAWILAGLILSPPARAQLPGWDFRQADGVQGWAAAHDLSGLSGSEEGMVLRISGPDPYAVGPRRDYPTGVPLRMIVRLRADESGTARVYYFTRRANEAQCVRADVKGGEWTDLRLHLPPLGAGYRIRINAPGGSGECVIQSIRFEEAPPIPQPNWPAPTVVSVAGDSARVVSGDLALSHTGSKQEDFAVTVGGKAMAVGWNRQVIGWMDHGKPVWTDVDAPARLDRQDGKILETTTVADTAGAHWTIRRQYAPASTAGAIDVETSISVDHDRDVIFLPMIGIFPGVHSFGAGKTQALFPGLEYLDNEPSSSEADVIGPASHRQVPDSLKITFPMMSVVAGGRYVGLIWQQRHELAAVFDSPDRLFGSGGHAMCMIFPGSDGSNRVEGNLLPDEPRTLKANELLVLRATIVGGRANDVTEGVRKYVALRGFPAMPQKMEPQQLFAMMAAGWLDSQVRSGSEYHHAIPGNFDAHPAADAAMYQDWLAQRIDDPATRKKLTDASKEALAKVDPAGYDSATVGHISYPVESLLYGHVEENAQRAEQRARATLSRFEKDGSLHYHAPAKGPDLGKTNATPEANGLTAPVVAQLLQDAAVCGNRELIEQGLWVLRAMDKFAGTVPRGAQTWEVPLHTPDVLASAYLVRAYVLGFELSGDAHFLERARYWAWTGVPFVYLTAPAEPVGLYASAPVFGATQWRAPVWMGLPVQWCALVYADSLYRLAERDDGGPWKQLADGIVISGIQQTWPKGSDAARQGLLPDSFSLRSQQRRDPAINPGTVMAAASRLYSGEPLYDFHRFPKSGLLVHAPGAIRDPHEDAAGARFAVDCWLQRPCYLLIAAVQAEPELTVDGRRLDLRDPNQYVPGNGRLIVQISGQAKVELRIGH
jgi:hypothetical protein